MSEPAASGTTPAAQGSGDRAGGSMVPPWVSGATNLYAMLLTAALVGLVLWLVNWLAPVLAPLGLGLFIAAIAAPVFAWFERRGRSAILALTLTIVLVVAIGAAIVWLFIASAHALSDSLSTYQADLQARYADATGATTALRDLIPPDVLVSVLASVTSILIQVGSSLAFAVVIAALLLLDGKRLQRLVASGLGSENPVFRETPGLARAAVTYIAVRVRINLFTAASILVVLLLTGVDYPLLWAVGTFFLSFVPYIGLTVALIAPAILAFAESGPVAAVVIVIAGIVLNVVAENILEPTLTGRALALATWLVFAMFFFWVWLLGPVGALLSMPITVLIVLVLERSDRARWVAALLAKRPTEAGS